jgi:DNA mismatch endonuclease (patch repair protein)
MASIRGTDTKPELMVRQTLHRLGYRFRIHRRDLPGCPDIVLPRYQAVIFVNGCFWHQHTNCNRAVLPKSRTDYWLPKLARTKQRDKANCSQLRGDGWRVLNLWECELGDADRLKRRLLRFLNPRNGLPVAKAGRLPLDKVERLENKASRYLR